jgi:hypothetical protein
MELDGLVGWYISVEHVRRMKSIWSGGSPLGMTSQGFVSGNKKKKYPCSTMYLSVQTHEQKQFTKLCNYHWLTEKNWHLLTNLQDKTVMQGYGSES